LPGAEIRVLPSADAVASEAARRFEATALRALAARGRFTVALAGGSTPGALYRLLAQPDHSDRIDWARTLIFFGDERCVPPDDPRSNYRMARETLLDSVPIPDANIFRMEGELPPPVAAERYEVVLRESYAESAGALPRLDLALLGLGADGHTASLFPGMPVLSESLALVAPTGVPSYVKPNVARLTLTFPALNAVACALFLVTGDAKAEAVRRALGGRADTPPVPASLVRPSGGELVWLLDASAASLLRQGEGPAQRSTREGAEHG